MSLIKVTEVFAGPNLPAGVTVASVAVTVVDSAGASQTSTLTGAETPTPWSAQFTVAAGKGNVSSVQTDSAGNAGSPVSQSFDTTAGTGGTGAPSLSGTTVDVLTP